VVGSADTAEKLPPLAAATSERWGVVAIKYSPDGTKLAACCTDKSIYVFAADQNYRRKFVLRGHNAIPFCLDFDATSSRLQSNDASKELLYWDCAVSGKQITNAFSLRDATWATWTCVLGWSVHGIFDADAPTEILAVARANAARDVLAAPGANNALRLLRFPATRGCQAKTFGYHSTQITSLDFSSDDALCFSVGGKDASLAQWLHHR